MIGLCEIKGLVLLKDALSVMLNFIFLNGVRREAVVNVAQRNAFTFQCEGESDAGRVKNVPFNTEKWLLGFSLLGLSRRGTCRGTKEIRCQRLGMKKTVIGLATQWDTMASMIGLKFVWDDLPNAKCAELQKTERIIGQTGAVNTNETYLIGFGYACRAIRNMMVPLKRRG
jgi:hypothetical protein